MNCVAWSPDSKFVASGGLDCAIIIWNVDAPEKHTITTSAHVQSQVQFLSKLFLNIFVRFKYVFSGHVLACRLFYAIDSYKEKNICLTSCHQIWFISTYNFVVNNFFPFSKMQIINR